MSSTHYRQQKVGRNFETAVRRSLMTRTALAKKLGVHQSSFSYWYKRGVTEPYAQKTADILNIDVNDIMSTHKRKAKTPSIYITKPLTEGEKAIFADVDMPNSELKHKPLYEQRTVNIELLSMVANMRLSAQQETTLLSVAHTFLGEES